MYCAGCQKAHLFFSVNTVPRTTLTDFKVHVYCIRANIQILLGKQLQLLYFA